MAGHKDLWFGQDGVTLSQHTTTDDRFPGWQESFGEGTFQADYTSGGRFPNDDASHIQVDDGFRATVMQNSYEAGNQGSGDKEEVFTGPIDVNLTDYDMNDMVSEIKVEKLVSDSDNNQDEVNDTDDAPVTEETNLEDVVPDTDITFDTEAPDEASLGETKDNNLVMYAIGAVVILGLGYMLMQRGKTAAPVAK